MTEYQAWTQNQDYPAVNNESVVRVFDFGGCGELTIRCDDSEKTCKFTGTPLPRTREEFKEFTKDECVEPDAPEVIARWLGVKVV